MERQQVTELHLIAVMDRLTDALDKAIVRKGRGAFVSVGEIRGYLDEEVGESHDAMHANDNEAYKEELMDIVISAFWGLASMETWDERAPKEHPQSH